MKKKNILKSQSGQGLIEYLIIVALVAAGSIAIMKTVGQTVQVQFAKVATGLGATSSERITRPAISSSSYQRKSMSNFLSGSRSNDSNSENETQEND